MQLKGSKTEDRLRKAYVRELHAHASYENFAAAAQKAALERIADIFKATAENEAEHARHEFNFLNGSGDVRKSLQSAIKDEHVEAIRLYPEAAKIAEEEGFTEIADFFRRMAKVEANHEKNYRALLEALNQGGMFRGKTVGYSAIEMAQLMLPHQANPAGFVHGGEMMKLMDNAAGVVASRHSRSNVVTAMVQDIEFHNSVRVGDLVLIRAKLTFVSHASMEVQVKVETEDLMSGKRQDALTAYFVMVALDNAGKSMEVPPLIVSTEEEEALFKEGEARYQARKANSGR